METLKKDLAVALPTEKSGFENLPQTASEKIFKMLTATELAFVATTSTEMWKKVGDFVEHELNSERNRQKIKTLKLFGEKKLLTQWENETLDRIDEKSAFTLFNIRKSEFPSASMPIWRFPIGAIDRKNWTASALAMPLDFPLLFRDVLCIVEAKTFGFEADLGIHEPGFYAMRIRICLQNVYPPLFSRGTAYPNFCVNDGNVECEFTLEFQRWRSLFNPQVCKLTPAPEPKWFFIDQCPIKLIGGCRVKLVVKGIEKIDDTHVLGFDFVELVKLKDL